MKQILRSIALAPLLLSACTSSDVAGVGSLQLALTGSVAMREGFPHAEEGFERHEFVDGWSLDFDKFLMAIGEVRLREQEPDGSRDSGPIAASWTGPAVVDLMRPPSGVELEMIEEIPATRLDLGFDIVAATPTAENLSAGQDDFDNMVSAGHAVFVEGTATNGDRTVQFRVGLSAPTRFEQCANGVDQTRGIAIEADKVTGGFIYPHLVHLWWDVLIDGTPKLRFEPWAAAAVDGVVTEAQLANQNLLDLKNAAGDPLVDPSSGTSVRYDDGGLLPPDQLNLLSYSTYGFRQSVHFNGLGFCRWSPL